MTTMGDGVITKTNYDDGDGAQRCMTSMGTKNIAHFGWNPLVRMHRCPRLCCNELITSPEFAACAELSFLRLRWSSSACAAHYSNRSRQLITGSSGSRPVIIVTACRRQCTARRQGRLRAALRRLPVASHRSHLGSQLHGLVVILACGSSSSPIMFVATTTGSE